MRIMLLAAVVVLTTATTGCGIVAGRAAPAASPSATVQPATSAEGDCRAVPAGAASVGALDAMATKPVGSAIAENTGLSLMGSALVKADLVSSLDRAPGLTVFVPSNAAFARLPEEKLYSVVADRSSLTRMVKQHVVVGRLSPQQLLGTHTTLAGGKLFVVSKDGVVKVDGVATVVCANVQTTNAVVYFIDAVLKD